MKPTSAISKQPLIGLNATIIDSSHYGYIGITGTIIDETRNSLIIQSKGKRKTIIKKVAIFHFNMLDGTILEIDGKKILGRPEERIKKHIRRRW